MKITDNARYWLIYWLIDKLMLRLENSLLDDPELHDSTQEALDSLRQLSNNLYNSKTLNDDND